MSPAFALSRRTLLAAASALAATTQSERPGGDVTAAGTVFDDASGTGRRSPGARGIEGVMVSNGREVVRTDEDGRWRLPLADGDAVFVIKPSGWITPLDPVTGLPCFSYVHAPTGTPAALALRYPGLSPTGPLPASIDFPLRRQLESSQFQAILLADPQPEGERELAFVRDDLIAAAAVTEAAFGITLGDVTGDDLSLYGRSNRIIGALGRPWYHLCGNHDMNYEAPDDRYSRETFKRVFGARRYAWQWGGVTFFALDNVEYLGRTAYRGCIGREQCAFVAGVLANVPREAPVVVCMHIPLRTVIGTAPAVATVDTAALLRLLTAYPRAISFSGHTHTNEHHYLDLEGGSVHHHHVLAAGSGSWWSGPSDSRGIPAAVQVDGTPNGFHLLEADGSHLTTRLLPAHEPSGSGLRVGLASAVHAVTPEAVRGSRMGQLVGTPIARAALAATDLVVNLYDGGPRSIVAFDPGDGWRPMQCIERLDPYVQELYLRNPTTTKPWAHPTRCSHIWQSRLPATLAAGTHRIAVRARDEFGRPHAAALLLEVKA